MGGQMEGGKSVSGEKVDSVAKVGVVGGGGNVGREVKTGAVPWAEGLSEVWVAVAEGLECRSWSTAVHQLLSSGALSADVIKGPVVTAMLTAAAVGTGSRGGGSGEGQDGERASKRTRRR